MEWILYWRSILFDLVYLRFHNIWFFTFFDTTNSLLSILGKISRENTGVLKWECSIRKNFIPLWVGRPRTREITFLTQQKICVLAWLQLWTLGPNKLQAVDICPLINFTPIIFYQNLFGLIGARQKLGVISENRGIQKWK